MIFFLFFLINMNEFAWFQNNEIYEINSYKNKSSIGGAQYLWLILIDLCLTLTCMRLFCTYPLILFSWLLIIDSSMHPIFSHLFGYFSLHFVHLTFFYHCLMSTINQSIVILILTYLGAYKGATTYYRIFLIGNLTFKPKLDFS